ncbi:TetR/AcrR family transcriptional regulator [Streptomyces kaempferi]
MPRPPDPAKRHDLLVRVRAYMIRNGVAGLSLRPLAQDLGTSDRMLLYYFGTKERMVTEALAVDERRPLLRAQALLDTDGSPKNPAELRHFLEESWQELSGPGLRAALPSTSKSWPTDCSIPTCTGTSCATCSASGHGYSPPSSTTSA